MKPLCLLILLYIKVLTPTALQSQYTQIYSAVTRLAGEIEIYMCDFNGRLAAEKHKRKKHKHKIWPVTLVAGTENSLKMIIPDYQPVLLEMFLLDYKQLDQELILKKATNHHPAIFFRAPKQKRTM